MGFTPESPRVPTSIGNININITDFETGADTVMVSVEVKDASGRVIKTKTVDLIPHLSAAQITGLQALRSDVRTKAQVLIP